MEDAIGEIGAGEFLLLENTRFHPEEKDNDPEFAKALARPAEIFVREKFFRESPLWRTNKPRKKFLAISTGIQKGEKICIESPSTDWEESGGPRSRF